MASIGSDGGAPAGSGLGVRCPNSTTPRRVQTHSYGRVWAMCVARELCLDGLSRVEIFGAIARRDTLHKLVQQPHLRVCRQPWLDTAPSCWVGAEELEDVVAPAVLDGGVGSLFEQVLDYRVAPYALLRRDLAPLLPVRVVVSPAQRGLYNINSTFA